MIKNKPMRLSKFAKEKGFSTQYFRSLVNSGKIPTHIITKLPSLTGSQSQIIIDSEAFDEWRKNRPQSPRSGYAGKVAKEFKKIRLARIEALRPDLSAEYQKASPKEKTRIAKLLGLPKFKDFIKAHAQAAKIK